MAGDWKLPWAGGCRCRQTRIAVSAPPLLASACHCRGCQTMSASAFSLTLAVPTRGFTITQGEPVLGGLKGATRHFFCPHCLSWMFTRPEQLDDLVNLRPSTLDDHGWFAPFVEVWTSHKLPWAATSAPRSFVTQPDFLNYGALMAEYAENGARPG